MDYTNICRLDGRVALVTGAARGMGSEIAHALMQVGACVMVTDLLDALNNETKTALATKAPGRIAFMQHDVTREADWMAVVQATIARFGGLDIVVNNADTETAAPIADCELADFQQAMAMNVDSAFLGIKHAICCMRPGGSAGRGGSIINLCSIAGMVGLPSLGAYGASKGAVRQLTKAAAAECGHLGYGIRVNAILPAIGCYGQPSDVANAALFLASDASRWVTGTEIVVDGGATAI
jgi:NAD(P)-dependent dehydrogenase (short-subunit alcohol dehydrogenase family)